MGDNSNPHGIGDIRVRRNYVEPTATHQADIDRLLAVIEEQDEEIAGLRDQNTTLRRLVDEVRGYDIEHYKRCQTINFPSRPCDCGLDKWRTEVQEATG